MDDFKWLKPFEVGEWVGIGENSFFRGFTGFVVSYDYEDFGYRVQLTLNPDGLPTSGVVWIASSNLNHAEVEIDDFMPGLIDTLLFLKQKEWFLEITSKECEEQPL